MQAIVQVRHLNKIYPVRERRGLWRSTKRNIHALSDVSFDVAPGELFGLLGPNGAGKTTLIKCLTTLLLPTNGTISINGHDVVTNAAQVCASIGCALVGERGLYWKLTGRENLAYFTALYGVDPALRTKRMEMLIERLNLAAFIDRAVETYSSGQKKRLLVAKALVNDAPLLIFDEPTSTLDIHSAHELRALVRDLHGEGRTIIYTTHLLHEAEDLCQRIAIIDQGKIVAIGTLAELRAKVAQDNWVRIHGRIPAQAVAQLGNLPAITSMTLNSNHTHQELLVSTQQPQQAIPQLIQALANAGAAIEAVERQTISLEEVFLALTKSSQTTKQAPA